VDQLVVQPPLLACKFDQLSLPNLLVISSIANLTNL
jgi:hypothetical protein